MHPLSPAIERLLKILRGSAYPALADSIEVHLRLGRTRLFDEMVDIGPVADLKRAATLRGEDELAPEAQPTDDDESESYSEEAQIEEALALMRTFIGVRVAVLEDSYRALEEMDRGDLTLRLEAEDADLSDLLEDRRSAMADWTREEGRIREWLMKTVTGPDGADAD